MRLSAIFLFFISISAFSQSKVGTVDVDFILSKMPELTSVQTQIDAYGKELDSEFNKNMESYNALVKEYQEGEVGFTIAEKKTKQEAIISAENDLNKFQQNGTKLINLKQDELLRPLYQKIGVVLEKIAQAEGFTQVLQLDNSIVYADNAYDLTLKILTDLGISIEETKE